MAEINIESGVGGYIVTVSESGSSSTHEVTVADDDITRLGAGAPAVALIEASFRFLLERESKESILSSFDLSVIDRYFPEYASRIGDYL